MTPDWNCQGGDSRLCATCRRHAPTRADAKPAPLYDGGKCEEYWKVPDANP
jgi:hypothetical protein